METSVGGLTSQVVDEAMVIYTELTELADGAHPLECDDLRDEILNTPSLNEAIEAHRLLGKLSTQLNMRMDQLSEVAPTIAVREENYDNLELDDEAQEARITQTKIDITSAHEALDTYSEVRGDTSLSPTKKHAKTIKREIRRTFDQHWTAEELVAEPWRLKAVADSIIAKENVDEVVRKEFLTYLLDRTCEYVSETAATTSPDELAERIKICAEEGLSQNELQQVLLQCYFKRAEGRNIDIVLDNYERFCRGLLRCASSHPEAAQFGIDIALFNTAIIPADSLYAFQVYRVPAMRLDRPDLIAKKLAIGTTLTNIQVFYHGLGRDLLKVGDVKDAWAGIEIDEADLSNTDGCLALATKMLQRGNFRSIVLSELQTTYATLGSSAMQQREAILYDFLEITRDPKIIVAKAMEHVADIIESERFYDKNATQMMRDLLISIYPGNEDFIDTLLLSRSELQDEAAQYIPDSRHDYDGLVGNGKLTELLGNIEPGSLTEAFYTASQHFTKVEADRRDGYIVEWIIPKSTGELTDSMRQAMVLDISTEEIEAARRRLGAKTGIERRYELIETNSGGLAMLRPESDEDRKLIHPLNEALTAFPEVDKTELQLNAEIERARQNIALMRRRFLSNRGISTDVVIEGIPKAELRVFKHSRNPRAFVGKIIVRDRATQFIIRPDLRIELSGKRILSNGKLLALNVRVAELLEHFMCQDVIETDEGTIEEDKSNVVGRIAHLHMLPVGQHFSYTQWEKCLDEEGEDLEVLSALQAQKRGVDRSFTYYPAIERDNVDLGPLKIHM